MTRILPFALSFGATSSTSPIQPSSCGSGKYYDSITLACYSCANNAIPREDKLGCECPENYATCRKGEECWPTPNGASYVSTINPFECKQCTANSTTSADGVKCMITTTCAANQVKAENYNSFTKECTTCSDPQFNFPGPDASECGTCPQTYKQQYDGNYNCVCRPGNVLSGSECMDETIYNQLNGIVPESEVVKTTFRWLVSEIKSEKWFDVSQIGHLGVQTFDINMGENMVPKAGTPYDSDTFAELAFTCAAGCNNGIAKDCQCIANLCALQLYDRSGSNVCKFAENSDGNLVIPQLFYDDGSSSITRSEVVLKEPLDNSYSFVEGSIFSELKFWVTKYTLEGEFLGWKQVTNELDLCSFLGGGTKESMELSEKWKIYGNSIAVSCELTENALKECGKEPVFYDLFIEKSNQGLSPVPIRIENLIFQGTRPNALPNEELDKLVLTKRFFLCEAVSGITTPGGYKSKADPVVFRYASHVVMHVLAQDGKGDEIYVPHMSIRYYEVTVGGTGEETLEVFFRSSYSGEGDFGGTLTGVFVAFVVIAVLASIWRVYQFDKRNPIDAGSASSDLFLPRIVKQKIIIFQCMVNWIFWFMIVIAAIWFFGYKSSSSPSSLLPGVLEGNKYKLWDIIHIIMMSLAIYNVKMDLLQQSKVVFFCLDREPHDGSHAATSEQMNPMSMSMGSGMNMMGGGGFPSQQSFGVNSQQSGMWGGGFQQQQMQQMSSGPAPPPDKVSIWRCLFIANELCERISDTRLSPFLTWLLVAGIMESFGVKNAARWQPNISTDDHDVSPYNPFLMFATAVGVWLIVVKAQLILQRIGSIWYGHPNHDFVDLCSLSNVSVIILDEPLHGYYIHGKAPGGRGDVSGTLMTQRLKQEQDGLLLKRGFVPDDPRYADLQTFEMFFPPHFAEGLYALYGQMPQGVGASTMFAEISALRLRIQAFFTESLDSVVRQANNCLLPKLIKHRVIGITQDAHAIRTKPGVFYEDHSGTSWLTPLMYGSEKWGFPTGNEWRQIMSEALMFSVIFRLTENAYVGAATAFLYHMYIKNFRTWIGRRTLSRTAFVDPRFLI